jgi:DNA-binding transcriptional ArsR family regulator
MLDLPLRAIGDPVRREILRMLAGGPMAAGQIASRFDISLSTVSHHLSVLRLAGLVTVERRSRSLVYSLEAGALDAFLQELGDYFGGARAPARAG